MIQSLSRRLRVRDDGTGHNRDTDCIFSEFENEAGIILLGDPGMGKTTFFRDASNSSYRTVRQFLVDPQIPTSGIVFLDGLDEYRSIVTGQDASAEVAKALCSLRKPKFRLSCRAADWYGALDQEILRTASASGRVVVLELCPLSRDEILVGVQEILQKPVEFLNEAEAAGLGSLLGNPQTLDLIARAWRTDKKPQNKFEAFEIGVFELVKEANVQHVSRGIAAIDPSNLRKAASAISSTILLSNSVGISRTESADRAGFVRLSVVPCSITLELDAVLKRRLFRSSEVDNFEPIHRTIAEFLAAEDLAGRIRKGLPIERAMALMCGTDGKPVSSLRGLFAWLMCKLPSVATGYVARDPYGVAMYGDNSVLPPEAQNAIWDALSRLGDPWFLTNEDDRGSFRGLANPDTTETMRGLLEDSKTTVHLKIAILEAIANSMKVDQLTGFRALLRTRFLDKTENGWIRSTALKAYVKSIQNDPKKLQALDAELAQTVDDNASVDLRVDLLTLTPTIGNMPVRILSIMEQANSVKTGQRILGRFYRFRTLPHDADLDVLLNGASRFVDPESDNRFDYRSLFGEWLKRRLDISVTIDPPQLTDWLQIFRSSRNGQHADVLASLKGRFERDPSLFKKVLENLINSTTNQERSLSLFLAVDLWKLLPSSVWPISQSEFFLSCAENDPHAERAAEFFRVYQTWFPSEEATVAMAEAGFELLDRRPEVAKVLGNWNICAIAKWREDQFKEQEKQIREHEIERADSVSYLTPRLTAVRAGDEENVLAWAAQVYLGFHYSSEDIPDARERLIYMTDETIADALIEGIIQYAEKPTIPTMNAVIESWRKHQIPSTHFLLSVSVFLRLTAGMSVSEKVLPDSIAAVVTNFELDDKLPNWRETLSQWFLDQARTNPATVRTVLGQLWFTSATIKYGILPGFDELSHDISSLQFLALVSSDVLRKGISEDRYIISRLISILLLHDRQAAVQIGETELARTELAAEVRAIWSTVLYVIEPTIYLNSWKTLVSGSDVALWQVIEVIDQRKNGAVSLTSGQRTEIITIVGQRFANIGHPVGSSKGRQNPWDAAEFIANQIKLLAADSSPDVDFHLQRLENDDGLASYRNLIKHLRAQRQREQRESSFVFASPEQVAEAIANRAPATPSDLLAFIIDHVNALSRELRTTANEGYRAYWNESDRRLEKPKREEVCSGLLATDLQNRIKTHNLVVTVEHHMVEDKECDLMVLQGADRILPVEAKHQYHPELWTAWRTQLDRLYTRDAKAGGLGIYLVFWSGVENDRKIPRPPDGIQRPTTAAELKSGLESLIPEGDRHRLRVAIVDISVP